MVKQNNEIYDQKILLNQLQHQVEDSELKDRLHKRWAMIIGEGAVFIALMTLSVVKIRNTFRKEASLAKQQRNFLLSVTHELKSPLASCKLQLETLLKRDLEKEKQKSILQAALTDTERLNNLVENILLASKIEASDYPVHKEKTNVSELINEIIAHFQKSLNEPDRLTAELEKNIFLEVDPMTFPSILINLLENSIKYSPHNSQIKVSLRKKSDSVVLSVADEGVGIPVHERNKIFEKFYRIGNEETRKTKGTGLGLYIIKFLVEKHNGKISVNDNRNQGSNFEIVFYT